MIISKTNIAPSDLTEKAILKGMAIDWKIINRKQTQSQVVFILLSGKSVQILFCMCCLSLSILRLLWITITFEIIFCAFINNNVILFICLVVRIPIVNNIYTYPHPLFFPQLLILLALCLLLFLVSTIITFTFFFITASILMLVHFSLECSDFSLFFYVYLWLDIRWWRLFLRF